MPENELVISILAITLTIVLLSVGSICLAVIAGHARASVDRLLNAGSKSN
jgi:hypothetical protein